jgi:hypothetical protein
MSGKSIFQYYLEALTKKYPYRVMDKDPYVLYSITQSCHKDYELYIFDGFQFRNHTIGEDKKTFDITYNGSSETVVVWKDGNR